MRHDPAIASIVIMLRELKMHGMAQAVAELAEQGAPAFDAAQPILSQLLKAETAEREVRSVAYQLKVARSRAYGALVGFDFGHMEGTRRWCASCTAVNSWRTPTTWCWWVDRGRARPTSPQPSGCKPSSTITAGCGSSPRWNWSMRWRRRRPTASPDSWPTGWPMPIW